MGLIVVLRDDGCLFWLKDGVGKKEWPWNLRHTGWEVAVR